MKEQAVRIASTRLEEFLFQSTAILEQSLSKKERLSQSQATREELPKYW